jgi:soluble lytic murein transglycosylase-like protein
VVVTRVLRPQQMLRSRRVLIPAVGVAAVGVAATAICVGAAQAFTTAQPKPAAASVLPRAVVPVADRNEQRTVAPLRRLTAPDVAVELARPARPAAVKRLWHVAGIRSITAVDTGTITVRGHHLRAIGVDAGRVRSFTPTLTAQSDALWQSVAGGDLTIGYAAGQSLRKRLGYPVDATGPHGHAASVRVGALASIGLGSAQALVSHAAAARLGLHADRRLFISAPHLDVGTVAIDVRRIVDKHAVVWSVRPPVVQNPMSAFAQATIPATYLSLYRSAASTCPGLPWTVLAGIGAVETGHGANVHRSVKGAVGPMQFLPSTFAAYGVDGNGDGYADINNPADAIYSAARYLCLWGASRGGQALYDAIWAYNHADWYVRLVVQYANAYA